MKMLEWLTWVCCCVLFRRFSLRYLLYNRNHHSGIYETRDAGAVCLGRALLRVHAVRRPFCPLICTLCKMRRQPPYPEQLLAVSPGTHCDGSSSNPSLGTLESNTRMSRMLCNVYQRASCTQCIRSALVASAVRRDQIH